MRASLAAVALFPAYALATFSISSPSSSEFWVFNSSNSINWTSTEGDPTSFNIDIINLENTTLNGAFSIASGVANNLSFEVTDVTLVPGDNYICQFVNSSNITQIFANSSTFSVKPAGTTPASPVSASSAASSGSSGSATSGTSGSSTASGSAAGSSSTSNGASSFLTPKSAIIAAGVMGLAALAI
ncbi:mitochondrial developmentally regulated MAPK-interacting protein [Lentinula aciculospora]|uniref:Mitochondrial developmentally regulated MAPK-interacting protein n=1 Tax=Lentinula aciculospora TaxID=153920 RepID=A0A9W9DKP1_9AGAR|nr:mitochondrial developmentally regulated MAPK-interacting protein [Lentinula aciculospora]